MFSVYNETLMKNF